MKMFGLKIFVIFAVTTANASFHRPDYTQRYFTFDSNGFHNGHVIQHNHPFGMQPNFEGQPPAQFPFTQNHNHFPFGMHPQYPQWPTMTMWPPNSPVFNPSFNTIPSINLGAPTFPFPDHINSVPFPYPHQPNFGNFGPGIKPNVPPSNVPYNPHNGFFNPFMPYGGPGVAPPNSEVTPPNYPPTSVTPPTSVDSHTPNQSLNPDLPYGGTPSSNHPDNNPSNSPDSTTPRDPIIDTSLNGNSEFGNENENGVRVTTESISTAGNDLTHISNGDTDVNENLLPGHGDNSPNNGNDLNNSSTEPIVSPPTSNSSPDDEPTYDIDIRVDSN